jgi:tetratricopeptide (TPR) repeat protein
MFEEAVLCHRSGNIEDARLIYSELLGLRPNHFGALNLYGVLQAQSGNLKEGIELVRKSVAVKSDYVEASCNLGGLLRDSGELDEAEKYLKKAVSDKPDYARAHYNLGNVLKDKGNISDAQTEYEKAAELQPELIDACYQLSNFRKFKKDEKYFSALESLKNKNISAKQKATIAFTLGKIYSDIDEYDKAFENYKQGNELRKTINKVTFNEDEYAAYINALIDTVDFDFLEERKGFGIESDLPVFIVGMPRSGTTLVEQIVSSHPLACGAGELTFINEAVAELFDPGETDFSKSIKAFDDKKSKKIARSYIEFLSSFSKSAGKITDKLPLNFVNLWFIKLLFPNAKILHCGRDPIDTCLSCYFHDFEYDHPYKNDLKTLGFYYRMYEKIMGHWKSLFGRDIMDVQYEKLVADPDSELKKIIAFCGLEWDEKCLEFYNNKRPVKTASYIQVRQKIYNSSVKRWKKYEKHLGDLISVLND